MFAADVHTVLPRQDFVFSVALIIKEFNAALTPGKLALNNKYYQSKLIEWD